jgi:hypothetical protein
MRILEMDDTYYFSQGRLISITPYNKFKDKDNKNNIVNNDNNIKDNDKIKDSLLSKFMNFQIYKKSILRYNL